MANTTETLSGVERELTSIAKILKLQSIRIKYLENKILVLEGKLDESDRHDKETKG